MINRSHFKYYIFLMVGILVLVNILANRYFFRLDFTEDQRYTLSESTLNILDEVQEPVTVKAYFSEGLQPQFDQMRRDFKDLLIEYASHTDGQIVFEFINPNKEDKLEQEAVQAGVQPVMINAREKDQSSTKKAFMGAVINIGETSETLPFIQPGAQMEYALTTAIKKMTNPEKAAIGFITGHGEPSIQEQVQVIQGLEVLYVPEEVQLSDSINLSKYKSLAWVNPTDSVPQEHLDLISDYLAQGGNLFLAINRVKAELQQGRGFSQATRVETWLKEQGLQVNENFVMDANCGSVTIQQRQGPFMVNTPVNFPYLPIISKFAEHPISEGLSAMVLQFGSSIDFIGDTTSTYTPLAFTSDKSATQSSPVYFNVNKKWQNSDFPLSNIPVAALLEKSNSKMVVIADGDLAINGSGQEVRQVQPDNANFMVNAIDFMSDDTGLIQLRSKQAKLRPIDQMEDGKKQFLKILNFALPLLIILLFGLFRYQQRKLVRLKRREENYV